ncbi:Protein kinase domain-containing protein [Trichostrongylus colubriformis]|uniref:Protein kinase domain-containing protein n=1 Tax=Trichostrongylus colubriformis TaxID=6319 RepID=A0AAN8FYC1_TRICO
MSTDGTQNELKTVPFPPHFDDLKRSIQMANRTGKKKGEESDFSAAVRETNERRAHELVTSTYYYWGSLVDSSNIDCLLTSESKEGIIKYYSVKCAANELIISGHARKLGKFIVEEHLQPVQRQYVWREEQVSPVLETPAASFDSLYEAGKVQRRKILFAAGKSIPLISIVAADLRPEERNVIINDLANFKDFGCVNTQRLWGSMVSDTQITVLLENTAVESLSNYVTTENRSSAKLLKLARQMATVVDFFERLKFIHKKLSIDVCLLTANENLKVVVFCLSTGLIPKRIYMDDVERCRWMPWECLKGYDGSEPDPYDQPAVIWTLGTMVWSMFHRAAIPFENETVAEIRSRAYRKDATLDIIEELLPNGVLELLQSCWAERSKRPSSRAVLKALKKLEQQSVTEKSSPS